MSIFSPTVIQANLNKVLATTHQTAATATGSGTTANLSSGIYSSIMLKTSSGAAKITPEISPDGSSWSSLAMMNIETGEWMREIDLSLTGATAFVASIAGAAYFRARISDYTSGSISASTVASQQAIVASPVESVFLTTHHNAAAASGNGAAGVLRGLFSGALVRVNGSGTWSIEMQGATEPSFDYPARLLARSIETGEILTAITTTGLYWIETHGIQRLRAVLTYTSGAVSCVSYAYRGVSAAFDNYYQIASLITASEAIQAAVEDTDTGYTPLGAHTAIADLSSAATITPAAGAREVIMQAYAQAVRYTLDGTTPTATTGFKLAADAQAVVPVGGGSQVKVIEETASATLQYQAVG